MRNNIYRFKCILRGDKTWEQKAGNETWYTCTHTKTNAFTNIFLSTALMSWPLMGTFLKGDGQIILSTVFHLDYHFKFLIDTCDPEQLSPPPAPYAPPS